MSAPQDEKDLEIVLSDQVKEAMAADPELAKSMKDFSAMVRQAHHGIKTGQYKSFDDAMEALTGSRPEYIDLSTNEGEDG